MAKKAAIIICFNAWNEISAIVTIDFIKSIVEKTDYPDYEIILYENNSKIELFKKIFDYINSTNNICIKVISPINKVWYNMNREYNDATKITDADIFIFANNDMKIINKDWLVNIVKWLDSNSNIGMICPHTNITYGNFFNCKGCILDKQQRKEIEEKIKEEKIGNKGTEVKHYSCLFTEGCTRRFQDSNHTLWYREWPSMGIYACTRDALEKIGMQDTNMDLHGQDLSIMLKFENAGFKIAVAMDSLVEHNEDKGHVTLDYIAKDGSEDYNFRSIHAYKHIYDYLQQNNYVATVHPASKIEWDRWYNDFYMNYNPSFNREDYYKWVDSHRDEWSTDIRYGHVSIAVICTLSNSVHTDLTINTIESILNSDIKIPITEVIIYENNSDTTERSKFFDYINKKKLSTDIKIKWISVNRENFNRYKVYDRLSKFTRNEIICFTSQDIEVISKDWLKKAIDWILHSEYRDKIGILLVAVLPVNNTTVYARKELKECGDTNIPIFFIKKYVLDLIGGFDNNSPHQIETLLYHRIRNKGLKAFKAMDILVKTS